MKIGWHGGKNVQKRACYGSVGTGCGVQNACILGGEARCVQLCEDIVVYVQLSRPCQK
jgi:hypothetical protein